MAAAGSPLEFRVLGPVQVLRDGAPLPIGGPRQRALLALLLLEPGRPVGIERLIDGVWAGRPPDGARGTLATYVSRLRGALGDASVIAASPGGLAAAVAPESIDSHRFECLVRDAQAALVDRGPAAARTVAEEALALWRGSPYGPLADEGALQVEAARLEEVRLEAIEVRLDALLALGEAPAVIDELGTLVRTHPLREGLWLRLMLALYRSGRQAEALAAYQRARAELAEQLGARPGEAIERLQGQILRHEVPDAEGPGSAMPPAVSALPAPLTTFIGRASELAELEALIEASRLVTLTGVGGVGKTRLALEVARRSAGRWPDGVVLVDLSGLSDPDLLDRQVAAAFDLREQSGLTATQVLAGHIGERRLLLVLDNCEHLVRACADLVEQLVARCEGLRVLATSREPLDVPSEARFAVQPLAVPPADASLEALAACDAVELFVARAREARRTAVEEDAALRHAVEICRDLDGLPLAIELAAARARVLSLEEIARRVKERFQFLVSWRRVTSARHRTLRLAMDWSYDLLTPPEQRLLAGLAVFAGGCTPHAVAAICTDDDEVAALAILDRLVASSLVIATHGPGGTRFRLLETVREYAAGLLEGTGTAEDVRRAHAGYYRSLVAAAWEPIRLGAKGVWMDRLGRERDNLRAALAWAWDAGDPELLVGLAEGLWYFWWVRGDFAEGRQWLGRALDVAARVAPMLRSRAELGAARLAWAATDFEAALPLAEAAWASMPQEADALDRGMTLQTLGVISVARGELVAARGWLEQAREQFEALPEGDAWRRDRLAGVILVLGTVEFFEGNLAASAERYLEALADCRARDDEDGIAVCELYLGHVDLLEGRLLESLARVRSSLRHYATLGWLQYIAEGLELIAFAAGESGAAEEAVRLVGAADGIREQAGSPTTLALARRREAQLPELRARLGDAAYEAALAAGRSLTASEAGEAAVALAGRLIDGAPEVRRARPVP